jgi:hypothetical protein
MSLRRPDVPDDILRAFTTGLGDFIPSGGPLWSLLLSQFFPLMQQNVSLVPLAAPAVSLESALTSTGWRFLAAEGDLYGACHVGSVRQGAAPILTGFSDDPLVLTAFERLNEVENLLAQKKISWHYTPSVLRITWLRLEAFWLHADPGSLDRVIPYAGFVGDEPAEPKTGLEMMALYDVDAFLRKIVPTAVYLNNQMLDQATRAQEALAREVRQQATAQRHALEAFADTLEKDARTAFARAAGPPDQGKRASEEPAGPASRPARVKRPPKSRPR